MSKERLEEIQKEVNYAYRRDGSISTKAVTMPIEHYEHLYEQAERVQKLEGINERLLEAFDTKMRVHDSLLKDYATLKERVQELEEFYEEMLAEATILNNQNKYYREALEWYSENSPHGNIADEALEE